MNPVIIVAEHRAASGSRLQPSEPIDGDPIQFQPQNRTEQNNNSAEDAVQFTIDISKAGAERIYPVGTRFRSRQSGWATSSIRRPTLPTSIQTNEVVLGQNLIAAGPWISSSTGSRTPTAT